jgi:hypothetical protein
VGRLTFTPQTRGLGLAIGATRAQVAMAIFGSDEYLQHVVEGFYQRFLDRAAEQAGLAAWTQRLKQGHSDEASWPESWTPRRTSSSIRRPLESGDCLSLVSIQFGRPIPTW